MLSTVLILASESEKSETPFFVVGVLFALWAVVLGVSGTRSETFVSGRGAMSAVIGVSVILAAASMALAIYVLA
jgi:ABC-type Na+ efflux pump permease subunit